MRDQSFSMSPKITVVVAAYNAEVFIRQTIDSVLAQTQQNLELIVVNDGSTDRTQEILDTYIDTRLSVLRQENSGVSRARNAGLAVARAPYVFFLDADDILVQNALSMMVDRLERNPHHVACFGHHIRISENGLVLTTSSDLRWKIFPVHDTLRQLIAKNFISCGAICIRTDAARAVRGFNPALTLGEDWDFWCRLAVLGDFTAMPDNVVLMYRQRFNSANYTLRKSPLRPDYSAVNCVYSNSAIRQKFSPIEFSIRRRLAKIDAFWAGARNEYIQGRVVGFLKYLAIGAVWYPDSILRPRLVFLFLRGLRQQLWRATNRQLNSYEPPTHKNEHHKPAGELG
jgi:glycosyltransferase involved in cell wall biosynthesis